MVVHVDYGILNKPETSLFMSCFSLCYVYHAMCILLCASWHGAQTHTTRQTQKHSKKHSHKVAQYP